MYHIRGMYYYHHSSMIEFSIGLLQLLETSVKYPVSSMFKTVIPRYGMTPVAGQAKFM